VNVGQYRCALMTLWLLMVVSVVEAQHPIDVERAAAGGAYYEALLTYDKLPKRLATTSAIVAAGRSAWGLSLPSMGLQAFELALRDETLPDEEKARLHLSRGIIYFQEDNPQVAILQAERTIALLPEESPLRSKAHFLWAESLARQGLFGQAEPHYEQALTEGLVEEVPDMAFALAKTELALGKVDEAKAHLQQVPIHHARSSAAVRLLAEGALASGDAGSATFWLNHGRSQAPDDFVDSWVDYARLQGAIAAGNVEELRAIRREAAQRYPAEDGWFTLLEASAEVSEWRRLGR